MKNSASESLARIREALRAATSAISQFIPETIQAAYKSPRSGPVTEADRASNRILLETLLRDDEGWLSEETEDDFSREEKDRVWVVDPLDGTQEFLAGNPEWCVSVALVERRRAVAGGVCNPSTGEIFLGSLDTGVTYNGREAMPTTKTGIDGAVVLASRSEIRRGEWEQFRNRNFEIRPVGSVAYKLALIAAGKADATWTLTPKNEWDIAAGVALVEASGGFVHDLNNAPFAFNNKSPIVSGLIAGAPGLRADINSLLADSLRESSRHKGGSSKR